MENQVIDILINNQNNMREDLKDLDQKIDQILEWKWKVMGGSVVVSAILTFVFQIALTMFQK